MRARIFKSGLIILALLGLSLSATCLEGADKGTEKGQVKREVITKEVAGEVGGIGNNFIAIDYGQTAKESLEIAIPMNKNTRGSHKNLKEIQVGDIVSVTYEETIETKEGGNPRVVKRLAKVVEFRQAARVTPETTVLQSQEQ